MSIQCLPLCNGYLALRRQSRTVHYAVVHSIMWELGLACAKWAWPMRSMCAVRLCGFKFLHRGKKPILSLNHLVLVLLRWGGGRRPNVKFEAGYLRLESIFCTAFTHLADKVKVILLSRSLRNAMACTMLPNVARLASNTMAAVILIT